MQEEKEATIINHIRYIFVRMIRIKGKERHHIPSEEELNSIEKLVPIELPVKFFTGTQTVIKVESYTTIKDLKIELMNKLDFNIQRAIYYSMYEICEKKSGTEERFIDDAEKVCDILAVWSNEIDAMKKFAEAEKPNSYEGYIPRCWIYTHPRGKACMSSEELYQLYLRSKTSRNFFTIVLAPRDDGVKALCVQLTEAGFNEIEQYCKEAKAKHQGIKEYVIHHIDQSTVKFYYQIPFIVSYELCQVVDLRNGDDVIRQISRSLTSGRAGNCW